MPAQLADEHVDAIACEPVATRGPDAWLCRVAGADDDVLQPFLTSQWWSHVAYYVECLATGGGGAYDEWGFQYDSDERDPYEEQFAGVKVFVPWGDVVVGRHAFERLMARWYRAILESVSLQGLDVVGEPWWPEFTANVAVLAARAAAHGEPTA